MNKKIVTFLLLIHSFQVMLTSDHCIEKINSMFSHENPIVYLYGCDESPYYQYLMNIFSQYSIAVEPIDTIQHNEENLYILLNIKSIALDELPLNYIVYQTDSLEQSDITENFIKKLSGATIIWDASRENINKYKNYISHYHFFPLAYEFADPIILPCYLSQGGLAIYKDLVINENTRNTDISSHLPTLFCYAFLQNPTTIVELGVRGGESTIALSKVSNYYNSYLIGVDVENCHASYYSLQNSLFFRMNDLDFPQIFCEKFPNNKINIVFVDTSHEYLHTMEEIRRFIPLLSENGIISFHDSNVTPLSNSEYVRLNGTIGKAPGNPRGVTQAIKEYFSISFDEYSYTNIIFERNNTTWQLIHYPFCNGLTIMKKVKNMLWGEK